MKMMIGNFKFMFLKRLLYITVLISNLSVYSQWVFTHHKNAFDGNYKIAISVGTGNEFPYNKPVFYVRQRDSNKELDVFIGDTGYYPDTPTVIIKIDNESSLYYPNVTMSRDNKTLFINSFSGGLSIYEFLDKLCKSNNVYIRITDNYDINDFTFQMSGSSKAIKQVIPNLSSFVLEEKAQAKIRMNKLALMNKIKDSVDNYILESVEKYKADRDSYLNFSKSFKNLYSSDSEIYKTKIDSVFIEPLYKGDRFLNSLMVQVYAKFYMESKYLGLLKLTENSDLYKDFLQNQKDAENNLKNIESILKSMGMGDNIIDDIIFDIKREKLHTKSIDSIITSGEGVEKFRYGRGYRKVILVFRSGEEFEMDDEYFFKDISS